jgi:hypothetical protein
MFDPGGPPACKVKKTETEKERKKKKRNWRTREAAREAMITQMLTVAS